jgi:hypothetical protein
VTEYEKRVLFAQDVESCYGLVKFAHLIENAALRTRITEQPNETETSFKYHSTPFIIGFLLVAKSKKLSSAPIQSHMGCIDMWVMCGCINNYVGGASCGWCIVMWGDMWVMWMVH